MQRRRAARGGLVFLFGLWGLFFWPVWLGGYAIASKGGDLWLQLYPVWSFVGESLRKGIFPLWDPRIMAGDPIAAEPQYGLFNPMNGLLFAIHPLPETLVHLRVAWPLLIGGLGMYGYLRRSPRWRLGPTAALTGAVAYMFADPFIVHLGHPQINDSLAWLPWAFWALDRALENPTWAPQAALPLALLGLGGHPQTVLYGGGALGLYALWRIGEPPRAAALQRAGILLGIGGIAVALTLPAYLPALERYPFTERAGLQLSYDRSYQWPPEMFLDLLSPWVHGRGAAFFWGPWGRIESAYVGAVALYLALPGFLADRGRARTGFLVLLGILVGLFALGYHGPFGPLIARVDLLARIGKTGRIAYLLAFVLAIGAALGIHHLQRSATFRRGWTLTLALGGLVLWMVAPALAASAPLGDPRARAVGGLRAAAALAWGTAGILAMMGRQRVWRAALPALLAVELIASGARVEAGPRPPAHDFSAPLAFLHADPGWFRVDVDGAASRIWPPAALQAAGFEVPQGTGNPMELREFNVLRWRIPTAAHPAYRMLGVKYLIVPKGAPPGGEGIWPVFTDHPAVDIHLHTRALPRAWLVYRTVVVRTYGEALEGVLRPDFRPETIALVENGPSLNGAGSGRIEVVRYTPHTVQLIVHTDQAALLVLSDALYPVWEAQVDERPAPIYRTNAVFRGVWVPRGTHRVTMQFRPRSVGIGGGAAAAGALLAGLWWAIARKSQPVPPAEAG
ncbi:MAG: hypothetical protein C4313_01885 [Thermoflexus sp.]|uniref:hypothetical protein n=1 Tax=Thermoflexus sp. TaxID=1969742 RepID=UPI00331DD0DC